MTDDGQGFAYGAGYAEATKNAQKKIDALVAALREHITAHADLLAAYQQMTDAVRGGMFNAADFADMRANGVINLANLDDQVARAALKAATE